MALDDDFAALLDAVRARLVERVDQGEVAGDVIVRQLAEADPRGDTLGLLQSTRAVDQADASVHGVLSAAERAKHGAGLSEVGRFIKYPVAERHGGVGPKHNRRGLELGDRAGLQPGVIQNHFTGIGGGVLMLGHLGDDYAVRQARLAQELSAAGRGRGENEFRPTDLHLCDGCQRATRSAR